MSSDNKEAITFSAQFGGQDAADVVLPHFWALKAAAEGIALDDFPYPMLAFILRVDGKVKQYGRSKDGNPEIDKDGEYLSIDIEFSEAERKDVVARICTAIMDTPPLISAALRRRGIKDFDLNTLEAPLKFLCARYKKSQS